MQEHIEDIVRALQEHLQSATVINGHRYLVAAADRAAHDAYLAEKYDLEYLADCAYYELEEC
jgi:hypothetical protein